MMAVLTTLAKPAASTQRGNALPQFIAAVALVVPDYDEAIAYYTGVLGFEVMEDSARGGGKRRVLVAPLGSQGTCPLLARAATPAQLERVGDQIGGACSCFCTPTISTATTPSSANVVSSSSRCRPRRVTRSSSCSEPLWQSLGTDPAKIRCTHGVIFPAPARITCPKRKIGEDIDGHGAGPDDDGLIA